MRMPLTDPADEASVDTEHVCRMVDLFLESGFTYFDTGWMYNGFASEPTVKKVLTGRYPRESFTLATKLHTAFFDSFEGRDEIFNAQLEKTGAGYFDYYLLHGIHAPNLPKFNKYDCFEWLLKKKEQGIVRHIGFSYHDTPELLDRILTDHPEMEFVQIQLNYLDWESEWIRSRECYETVVKHGKQVIVMEPVKGGTLARLPAEAEKMFQAHAPEMSPASWAIRFAASLPNVMAVLSGMSTLDQVRDNVSYMKDFQPLTEEEAALCVRSAELINSRIAVPCTGCSYCTDGCPMNIAIPKYFSLYNEDMREDLDQKGWTINFVNYEKLTNEFGRAGECISCGQCEDVCPQHIPVIEKLKDVAAHFEK